MRTILGIHEGARVMALRAWWARLTRLFRTRSRRNQEQRMQVQAEGAARSPAEAISQREDRRLAGMSAEDRAWEQASLGRNRDTQARGRTPKNAEVE